MRLGAVFLVIMGTVSAAPVTAQAYVERAPAAAPVSQHPMVVSQIAAEVAETAAPAGLARSFPFGLVDAVLLGLGSLVLGALACGAPFVLHRRRLAVIPDIPPASRWEAGAVPDPVTPSLLSAP